MGNEANHFEAVFDQLKAIMAPYAERLVVVTDEPDHFFLDEPDHFFLNTAHIMKNKQPPFFGAVQIKKRYVSYHLMPVYAFPDLLLDLSEPLKKRMQGKSCFNFTTLLAPLLAEELARLTTAGFDRYRQEGIVPVSHEG